MLQRIRNAPLRALGAMLLLFVSVVALAGTPYMFRSDVKVGGNLQVVGASTQEDIAVTDDLTVGDDATITGTILGDTITERTADAGVTVDGLHLENSTIAPVAGGTAWADLSACATGEADTIVGDNLADAYTVRQGANAYFTLRTTDNAESVVVGKLFALPTQTIDMADAQVALVHGAAAGAGEVLLTGNVILVDANSGATENLRMPAPSAALAGVPLILWNVGGEDINLQDSGGNAMATLGSGDAYHIIFSATGLTAIAAPA